ncbi:hypothetical protein BJ165DRAFT_577720 [Panaeolus papilionaceus]|nr:hypothetical protein BJ165DRAFT_577720 [Panaeolus papilionaceus]
MDWRVRRTRVRMLNGMFLFSVVSISSFRSCPSLFVCSSFFLALHVCLHIHSFSLTAAVFSCSSLCTTLVQSNSHHIHRLKATLGVLKSSITPHPCGMSSR